jgi:hypothetical protein
VVVACRFCEKGSLERAVRLGKFKRKTEEQGKMVGTSRLLQFMAICGCRALVGLDESVTSVTRVTCGEIVAGRGLEASMEGMSWHASRFQQLLGPTH